MNADGIVLKRNMAEIWKRPRNRQYTALVAKNARRGTAGTASNLHKNGVIGRQFAPVDRRTARLAQRLIYTITALSGGSLRSWTGVRRGTTCAAPNLRKNGVVWPQFVPVNPTCVAARLAQSPICAKRRCRAAVCTSEPAHSAAGAACNLRENGAVVRRFASVDRRASRHGRRGV